LFFAPWSPRVYIEMRDSSFFIGKLYKKDGYFYCEDFEESLLQYSEIKNGLVNNPSAIYLLIKSFLEHHGLQGAKVVVCSPGLKTCSQQKQKIMVFQIALCVCKAGLKIYKILDQPLLRKRDGHLVFSAERA